MAEDAEATVETLAGLLGVAIRPEHLAEVVAAWRFTAPHIEAVRAVDLAAVAEPASLFRP